MPAGRNPVSNLMYDWLTVLQSKAEGLNAYEQYIRDAEQENAAECVAFLRQLHDEDSRQVQQIQQHVFGMIRDQK